MSRQSNIFADYEIVPDSASMYREGGSYMCNLINRDGVSFEFVFPIITERLNWRSLDELSVERHEELDSGANLYRLYHPPAIYKHRFKQELIANPSWVETYAFLSAENPSNHPRKEGRLPERYGGDEFIIDYMADMIEAARQNMEREAGNG